MSHDDAMTALQPMFDAMRRGSKRSRIRQFVAVCERGHTLLEVFPTPQGPVILCRYSVRWDIDENGELSIENRPKRRAWRAEFVPDTAFEGQAAPASECRCTESPDISIAWVWEQLDAGVRRAVRRG